MANAGGEAKQGGKPSVIVICGPSGVGKGTLLKRLLDDYPSDVGLSVSVTTRQPRPGEVDGVHYNFMNLDDARALVSAGGFLEHAEVHGNLYGTSRGAVETVNASGRTCVLEIDWQGAQQVKQSGLSAMFVAIAPPSLEELERRLRARGTETEAAILKRLHNAKQEVAAQSTPDFWDAVVVNDTLDEAYAELKRQIAIRVDLMLTTALANSKLKKLGPTADATAVAYLELHASDLQVRNVNVLRSFSQLQSVDLSHNRLADLGSISPLSSLLHLSVAHNQLAGAPLSSLPTSLTNLDASYNEIDSVAGIGTLSRLQILSLSHNSISKVEGLQRLSCLAFLDIGFNKLAGTPPLELPLSLRELNLASNEIESLRLMPDELPTLRNIDVSVNKLSDAAGFERCPALAIATLAHNRICAVSALQPLEALRCLLALDLSGNDVTTIADYRLHTLYPLLLHGVNVGTLDCMPTTTEEKVAAFNLYGHSEAELQDIRLRHFPDPNAEQARLALESAAVSVQSSFRGAAERRTERAATASAVAIQAHARGKHARNACDAMNSIGGVCPPTS